MRAPTVLVSLVAAVGATLAGLLAAPASVAPASAAPVSREGFPLPLPTNLGDPVGANDWGCRPSAQRPTPVILVHGTFGDRRSLLDPISAAMVAEGFCVFSFDYGNRATGKVEGSAAQLGRFVEKVRAATGASRVSLVGHSQGGMMPRYYLKHLGGAAVVEDLVGIAPSNHGTEVVGGPPNPVLGVLCRSCQQQQAGSAFLAALNAGDETPGAVDYTQITTRYDEVVVPPTSGYLAEGPRTTNVTIQDSCPADLAEHLLIPMSRTAIAWTLEALTQDGPARASFRPAC